VNPYNDGVEDAKAGEPYVNPYPPGCQEYDEYHRGFWSVRRQDVKAQA
jgi:hypothetical protein